MTIQLDPRRIRPNATGTGRLPERRAEAPADAPIVKPARAHVNFIPSPESLESLISNALIALRRGMRWERGTILNLLV